MRKVDNGIVPVRKDAGPTCDTYGEKDHKQGSDPGVEASAKPVNFERNPCGRK